MKGIIIEGLEDLPSIGFGSGTIQKEDIYRYQKRNAQGRMRRISFVGYTIRIDMKWGLLTRQQYEDLLSVITQEYFYVIFTWQGSVRREKFYAGNSSATPFKISNNSPVYYRDISFPAISLDVLTY